MKDYGAIQQAEQDERRIRSMQRRARYLSSSELDYLKRVAGTSTRFQGVNQRQRRKRARQVSHRR